MKIHKIGYVGVGSMGGPIARHLANKGFDVTVYDIRPEAMEQFSSSAVKIAKSLKALVDAVDCIMICVEDDYKVLNVSSGVEGILAYARAGQVIIIQSTCKISTVQKIEMEARNKGVEVIDAPVSGNLEDRENGTLGVYVGGAIKPVEECRHIFNAIGDNGKKVMHLGAIGYGELGSLINNAISGCQIVATLEGLKLGRVNGISEEKVIQVAKMGSGRNYFIDTWPYFDELMKSHRLGPGMCRIDRKDMLDAAVAALEKGLYPHMIVGIGELMEKVYFERAEHLAERDGYDFPKEMPIVLKNMLTTCD